MPSAISTPTFAAQNASILNDGSADSPRGWALANGSADYTFTATGPSRVRFTTTDTSRSVNLPTTGIKAGYEAEIVTACAATKTITIKSSNGNTVDTMIGTKGRIRCVALQDAPTTSAHWEVVQVEDAGTWTPSLTFGGASVGMIYSTRVGGFTRQADRVTINAYIALSAKGSSTSNARIVGLPYTVATGANSGYTSTSIWANGVSKTNYALSAYTAQSSTQVALDAYPTNADGGSGVNLTDTNFSTTAGIMIATTYVKA